MVIVLLAGFGLIFGSFANAVVWRLHEQQSAKRLLSKKRQRELSILHGRSMCVHCHQPLQIIDLVPVASYLWLRGKCRYCGKPIDDTPLAELLTPVLFIASYLWWPYDLSQFGFTLGWTLFVGWLLCLVAFVILGMYDYKWCLLPDRVVFPLIGLALVMVTLNAVVFGGGWDVIVSAAWGVALTSGLFYLIYLVSHGSWIGLGDVKLMIALGVLVGGPLSALLLLFIASLGGSLASLPLLFKGQAVGRTRIPFGPFLLFAAVILFLFGQQLGAWYSGLLIG